MNRKFIRLSRRITRKFKALVKINSTVEVVGFYQGWEHGDYVNKWLVELNHCNKIHTFEIYTKQLSVDYVVGYINGVVDQSGADAE